MARGGLWEYRLLCSAYLGSGQSGVRCGACMCARVRAGEGRASGGCCRGTERGAGGRRACRAAARQRAPERRADEWRAPPARGAGSDAGGREEGGGGG